MIKVTRLNDSVLIVNVEMIQSLQATPDTVITFTNHDRLMVKEPVEEISQRIVEYQRLVNLSLEENSESMLKIMEPRAEIPLSDKGSY
jgi:flagellar protein FlbD